MYAEMYSIKKTVEIFHPFVFLCYSKRQQRDEAIIAFTLRVLSLAGCSAICDLTSWYLSLAEVLTEKNYVPMKNDKRFILFV